MTQYIIDTKQSPKTTALFTHTFLAFGKANYYENW